MTAAGSTARTGGGVLFTLITVGLVLAGLVLIGGYSVTGITKVVTSAINSVWDSLLSAGAAFLGTITQVIKTIIFGPIEFILNELIAVANIPIPNSLEIDAWDLTGDGTCSGAPSFTHPPVDGRCAHP